jgi:uncharacterized protein YqjF (DUF2071 family)
MNKRKFLTAEWRKLIMANYEIDPGLLSKYIPRGTELDIWNNKHYVSLVGFMFMNTRVLGIRVPLHTNFQEVNLRFYVRYKDRNEWKRGVVFISEIVPKPVLSFVANTLYNEHYSTLPMKHEWKQGENSLIVSYQWKNKGKWNKLEVSSQPEAIPLQAGTKEEFITQHFWGYTLVNNKKTAEYHVDHPRWNIYPVKGFEIDCDFEGLYGSDFAILKRQQPASIFLAEGSEISVYNKRVL